MKKQILSLSLIAVLASSCTLLDWAFGSETAEHIRQETEAAATAGRETAEAVRDYTIAILVAAAWFFREIAKLLLSWLKWLGPVLAKWVKRVLRVKNGQQT